MMAVGFFPPALAALSQIGSPPLRNLSVAFTVPVGFLIGGGVTPAVIGILGEVSSFSLGVSLVGGCIMGGVILSHYLNFQMRSFADERIPSSSSPRNP